LPLRQRFLPQREIPHHFAVKRFLIFLGVLAVAALPALVVYLATFAWGMREVRH